MPIFSLNQHIDIIAARAFFKLAHAETHPRRRRERRRTAASSTSLTRRPPSLSPGLHYSHIRIIPSTSDTETSSAREPLEPVFRKPSLMQDSSTAYESPASPPQQSLVSLANNIQGTTFAAKARAAELQAARARKELRSHALSTSHPAPHEIMTFKSKPKGGRTWKRLNLNDLPPLNDEGDDSALLKHYGSEAAPSSLEPSKSGSTDNLQKIPEGSGLYKPTLAEAKAIQQSGSSVASLEAPRQHTLLTSKEDFPAATLNLTDTDRSEAPLPTFHVKTIEGAKVSNCIGVESQQYGQEISYNPNPSVFQDALNFHYKQQYGPMGDRPHQHFLSASSSPSPATSLNMFGQGKLTSGYTDGPAGNYFLRNHHTPSSEFPIVYTQPAHIPPLKYKPPHHYPAVKGTQNNLFKQPIQVAPAGLNHITYKSHEPSSLYSQMSAHSGISSEQGLLEAAHRALAARDSTVTADHDLSRSVLHDPFSVKMITEIPTQLTPSNTSFKQDLYESSEELPWKNRMVDIYTPDLPPTKYPTFEGYELTPDGLVKIISPSDFEVKSSHEKQPSSEDTESQDDRFHPELIPWMHKAIQHYRSFNSDTVITSPSAQHNASPSQSGVDQKVLIRANIGDECPDTLQSYAGMPQREHCRPEINDERCIAEDLLLPALASLRVNAESKDHLSRWGKAPDWSIDHSPDGDKSFFGGDWGAPPPRVGRDPRYTDTTAYGRGRMDKTVGSGLGYGIGADVGQLGYGRLGNKVPGMHGVTPINYY